MLPIVSWTLFVARQPLLGQGLSTAEGSRSHSDTPQTGRLPWTSDLGQ